MNNEEIIRISSHKKNVSTSIILLSIYIIKQDIHKYVPNNRPNSWTEWGDWEWFNVEEKVGLLLFKLNYFDSLVFIPSRTSKEMSVNKESLEKFNRKPWIVMKKRKDQVMQLLITQHGAEGNQDWLFFSTRGLLFSKTTGFYGNNELIIQNSPMGIFEIN